MKPFRISIYFLMFLVAMLLPGCGCSPKENHDHKHEESEDHKHNESEAKEEDHEHEEEGHEHEESPSGASFKPGKGIMFTDETRKILGVEIAEVTEEKLPQDIRFNVQIFGETHRVTHLDIDHTGCDVHGSGFLPPEKAAFVVPKQPVKLLTNDNEIMDGFVVAVQTQLAHGETEIVVGVTSASAKLEDGEFVAATITLPRNEAVTVIPKGALLRTAEGTFVYLVNDNAYNRTVVEVDSESGNKIEVKTGLSAGDQVVTKPVETLWLIELRATKGGGHSH